MYELPYHLLYDLSTSKNPLKMRNFNFPVVCYFTWKLEFISNILWVIVSGNIFLLLTQISSNLTCSKTFVDLSRSFNLKLEQLICKKALKFFSFDNCFCDLFTFRFYFISVVFLNLVLHTFQVWCRTFF